MASVQELLAVAEAQNRKRTPAASAMENLLLGMQEAQNNSLERAKTLIALDDHRKQQERLAEEDRQARAILAQQQEDGIRQGMRSVGGTGSPVLPSHKLETSISSDATGRKKIDYKIVDTADKTPASMDSLIAGMVARHELTLDEAFAMKAKASPSASVKSPAGYRYTDTGDLEAIPGGPVEVKRSSMQAKEGKLLTNTESNFDRMIKEAEAIRDDKALDGAVGMVRIAGATPGTSAYKVKARINTLKSKTGFSVLQDMRANSPTGGALGQVSDRENQMLQENISSLDTGQSVEDFKASLNRIIDYAKESKARIRSTYDDFYGGSSATTKSPVNNGGLPDVSKMSDEELRRLAGGQ
jgi:hypothetical protein